MVFAELLLHPCHTKFSRRSDVGLKSLAYVQELGWYNPLSKETNLNAPAIKKWLQQGAQPSQTVGDLLRKAMILGEDDFKRRGKQNKLKPVSERDGS